MKKILYILLLIFIFQNSLVAQTKSANLYVFVGKKISIEQFYPDIKFLMDRAYKAKYQILEEVYGHHSIDTIEFEVYDHYGIPQFSNYDYVVLYLSQDDDGNWFHQKYLYDEVYLTLDNKWAGPINSSDYDHPYNTNERPPAVELKFDKEIFYDLPIKEADDNMNEAEFEEWIKQLYPSEFYEIKEGKAYMKKGYYVKDLFELKKEGYLKARKVF